MIQVAVKQVGAFLNQKKKHLILSRLYCLLFISIILNLSINPALTQDRNNRITIEKGNITKPLTFEGISGGTLTAIEITKIENTATGYCDGFVDRQPNHILKLNAFFDYLRIEVESTADTTIAIAGPGGVWCNDDSDNTNPIVEGQWQPGVYKVWIGSYQADSNNNYRIKIMGNSSR